MSSIVGPYPGAENDYRRERITDSFREHRSSRRMFHRRMPKGGKTVPPAVDWFAA
jgi:hypothetical protein